MPPRHHAIEYAKVDTLTPYPRNARHHSKKQVRQIADSITRFGFTNPVLIGDDGQIIAGHGRVLAAKMLGMASVPTLRLSHLNEAERRAYVLADNKLALNAGWDQELLALELQSLIDLDFDVSHRFLPGRDRLHPRRGARERGRRRGRVRRCDSSSRDQSGLACRRSLAARPASPAVW